MSRILTAILVAQLVVLAYICWLRAIVGAE